MKHTAVFTFIGDQPHAAAQSPHIEHPAAQHQHPTATARIAAAVGRTPN